MSIPLIDAPRRRLRALYDWTLRWAETDRSLAALFLIAFIESSFFPIPPDVLLIAIVTARLGWWARAAAVCSAGSVLGGAAGYVIGAVLMAAVGQPIIDFYGVQAHWDRVVGLYRGEWGIWFLAAAAFTPIPYKVATIAAGASAMSFIPFILVSLVGRSARFFLVAAILRAFGRPVRRAVELHFDKVALAFLILLVLAFATLGDL